MNTLFSSQELLEMELSMLPKSKQGIDYRAKSGQWAFEYVAGKGRGGKVKKYLFSSLPPRRPTSHSPKTNRRASFPSPAA